MTLLIAARQQSMLYFLMALLFFCIATLLFLPSAVHATGRGVYIDAEGNRHPWEITDTHALTWNGKPFIPFGTWFVSHYLETGRDEEWTEDVAALEMLVSKGITDFYFGWANRTPQQYQRLIDWFEAHGCTYGIIPARYDWEPLVGYKMSVEKHELPPQPEFSFHYDKLKPVGAAFVVKDASGEILNGGIRDFDLTRQDIAFEGIFPETAHSIWWIPRIEVADAIGFDWWSGFQRHTDNVIAFLNSLNTGPGLRLIIDPFFNEEGFYWGTENVIPHSAAYRSAFEGWLRERYSNVRRLNEAWSVSGTSLESFEQAARLVPVAVGQQHGDTGYLLDSVTQRVIQVDLRYSVVLLDLLDGRDRLYAQLHNEIADAIRRKAIDVPIVYKRVGWLWRGFINRSQHGGFDGLGLEVYKSGDKYDVPAATYASELRQSRRRMWYITTETNHSPEGGHPEGSIGYPSQETLWADLDRQMSMGVKGVYLFAAQPQNERKIFEPEYDLLAVPEQYDWFVAYKKKVSSEGTEHIMHLPKAWFSFPVNSPELAQSGDLSSGGLPVDAWRTPDEGRTWVLPTYHADVETEVLFTCLDTAPLNRRYGAELASVIRKARTRVVYAGLRPHRELVPGLDELFTDQFVTENDVTYQVLKPPRRCEILGRLSSGEVWSLRTKRLTIVARDGALMQWAQGESSACMPLD